jgi:hypothetical protein
MIRMKTTRVVFEIVQCDSYYYEIVEGDACSCALR